MLRLAHGHAHPRCLLELLSVAGGRGQRMDLLEIRGTDGKNVGFSSIRLATIFCGSFSQ
jgi:hypothetical protein